MFKLPLYRKNTKFSDNKVCLRDVLLLRTCSKLENQPRGGFSAATSIWLSSWLRRAVRFHTAQWGQRCRLRCPQAKTGLETQTRPGLGGQEGEACMKPSLLQTRASSTQGKSCVGSSDFQKGPRTTFYVKYFYFEILAINFKKKKMKYCGGQISGRI